MNTKYQEDSIIITIAYQNGPEDNKRHSNLMFFIGYISFLIYCTVLRTCVLRIVGKIIDIISDSRYIYFLHEGI
jgi:hypothetical protein